MVPADPDAFDMLHNDIKLHSNAGNELSFTFGL
jgi:hypothetical protein